MQLCLPEGQIEELPVFLSDLSSRLRNLAFIHTGLDPRARVHPHSRAAGDGLTLTRLHAGCALFGPCSVVALTESLRDGEQTSPGILST
jgi:hypothetical protein